MNYAQDQEDLPEGWVAAPLSVLTTPIRPRRTPSDYPHLPYVGMEQVEPHTRRLLGTLPSSDFKSTAFHFQQEDILYGRLRPYLNKVWTADREGLCSSEFIVLPPGRAAEPKYLAGYLNGQSFVDFANQLNQGDRPRVSFDQIASHLIPLPPLAEQKRIVATVEEFLRQVEAAQIRLGRVPTILHRFRQAILTAACNGELTADWRLCSQKGSGDFARMRSVTASQELDAEPHLVRTDLDLFDLPEGWHWSDLAGVMSLDEDFCYGVVQPGSDNSDGCLLIRAGDLRRGVVDTSALRRIPVEVYNKHRRSILRGGELLITVVGAGIGTVAIAQPECEGMNIARAVAKVPVRDHVAKYVYYWLTSQTARDWMSGDAREVARPTLNLQQLKTIPVPVPPKDEQGEIVRQIDALFAVANTVERRVANATVRTDRLTQTILAKAFSGELVRTEAEVARAEGREYETASALLERVAATAPVGSPIRRRKKAKRATTH